MRSSVNPIMPLAQPGYERIERSVPAHSGDVIQKKMTFPGFGKVLQRYTIQRVIIDHVYS